MCEATWRTGEQSAAALDVRMACLHDGRRALEATVGELRQATPQLLENATELVLGLPTTWARRKGEDGVLPIVTPSVQAAAADADGNIWIATAAGITYVYDANGEKRRTVRFRGAGPLSPTAMSFTPKGRLLVAPGCYSFDAGRPRRGAPTPGR